MYLNVQYLLGAGRGHGEAAQCPKLLIWRGGQFLPPSLSCEMFGNGGADYFGCDASVFEEFVSIGHRQRGVKTRRNLLEEWTEL